jgi:hypothetical protein
MNWILPLLIGLCYTQASTAQRAEAAADSPVGVWRGESLCADNASSCKDEKVVYYMEAVTGKPDSVFIRADKIVDGKAITMGSGPWEYNRARHTLSWQAAQRLWLLTIKGKRIEGTLTLPGNVIARRMTLQKDP